jgi:hypothetical protein
MTAVVLREHGEGGLRYETDFKAVVDATHSLNTRLKRWCGCKTARSSASWSPCHE